MDSGFWLEQTLFQTLETWRSLDPQQRKLHFWRNRARHEVDFILEEAGKYVAIEIKASSQVTTNDATGIRAFREDLKRKSSLLRGVVLHGGKARPLEGGILALPWGWLVPASQKQ
jgi:predicted AAA+ superfamily ATPase